SVAVAAPPAPSAAPAARHEGPLASFHDALAALEAGTRDEHVRIVWLGDSHAQADFWPDAIRAGLGRRFGRGGPGFVHVGFKAYRHADLKFDIEGGWRMRPKQPSTSEPWGDGVFGLGGILHAGFQGARRVVIDVDDEWLAKQPVELDLCYKPGLAADRFELLQNGETIARLPEGEAIGKLHHRRWEVAGLTRFTVRILDGRPDFCGLTIDTQKPGVVLDNLGINGARYGTALAWNEEAWIQEIQRRPPELFIFEYGGNEASDLPSQPQTYKRQALELIARGRRAAPAASCLVVGPSDRVDAEARIPPIVQVMKEAAKESGCMFWNTYDQMGGKGSLRIWRDDGRGAPDGIHLKPKGYAEVGALLLADIMRDYRGAK
ncbi:MAG: hypothetical protein KC731_43510, partial [Myxococcales bacterium]|nr:hypothetical protein [Myxococcales bacterium]